MPIDNEVYDRLGAGWWNEDNPLNMLHGSCTPGRMGYFREVLDHRGDGGGRALDIGCGAGFIAEELATAGFAVTGIDPSRVAVEAARSHAGQHGLDIAYLVGAGEELPFPDAAFDLVSCCDVLEHVRDLDRVIAETARVLTSGGLYLFDTINRTRRSRLLAIKAMQEWRLTRIMDTAIHEWSTSIPWRSRLAPSSSGGMNIDHSWIAVSMIRVSRHSCMALMASSLLRRVRLIVSKR